ncbi:MAG: PilZ domain-containing protein [Candidatus Hydrogenedentes bacterium]|nr:PilZ domain-containing protein [Candidatus Hydrogenedentota bacterium]
MQGIAEQIREARYGLEGAVLYTDGAGEQGQGIWLDVSRVGGSMKLGRYLRPGRSIDLTFKTPAGVLALIPAQVVWCQPAADRMHFVAGFRVDREDPEASLCYAQLRHAGRLNKGAGAGVSSEGVRRWPMAASEQSNAKTTAKMAALPHAV